MPRKRGNVITISGVKKTSGGTKMLIGAAIVGAAGAAGYFLWKDYQKKHGSVGRMTADTPSFDTPSFQPTGHNERFRDAYYARQRQLLYQRSDV